MNISILQRVTPSDFSLDPFPHLVIRNALPQDLFDSLMETFPPIEVVNVKNRPMVNNNDCFLGAIDVFENKAIADNWRHFFKYHTSAEFFRQAVTLIAEPFRELQPSAEEIIGKKLEKLTIAVSGSKETADAYIQCQFGINSPVVRESSVRTAHVDNPQKLFNALLYCRKHDDPTPGGELVLYKFKREPGFYKTRTAMPTRIEAVGSVPYEANTLVLFLNSPSSVHGVSPRPPTPHVRRYINFQVELSHDLFTLPAVNPILGALERHVWG
jgi:2-oxoglutarate-Fe(II)-dependent oxygenase superfamily protein